MSKTVLRIRVMILVLLVLAVPVVWLLPTLTLGGFGSQSGNILRVHFLDVGQGDSIFIQTPDGVDVLIDGGRDSTVLRRLAQFMPFFDKHIDMIVGTHPDSDHVSGLIDVLKRFDVGTILTTENTSDTNTFHAFLAAEKAEGANIIDARRGQVFQLGASTTLRVLSPASDPTGWESNTSSIVLQLRYGSTTVLLTGDAPQIIEHSLVAAYGAGLHSDVLKPGHHGSRNSSAEDFIEAVHPTYAVISAGAHNSYGHPTQEVMDKLWVNKAIVYSTIDDGTVSFVSDGKTIGPEAQYPLATTIGGK